MTRFGWTATVIGCALVGTLAACGDNDTSVCSSSWEQWGATPGHDGASCVTAQPMQAGLAHSAIDQFVAGEENDAGGDLVIHYQAPLVDGDAIFMMAKGGTYTPCDVGSDGMPDCSAGYVNGVPQVNFRLNSEIWQEQAFTWTATGLAPLWSYDSDWKPEPGVGFEPMFQPALAHDFVAVPGAGGALWELSRTDGSVVRHVQPFGATIDPDTYVAGGVAIAPDGTIYYNAIKIDHLSPWDQPAQSWLVQVAPDGTATTADYTTLLPGAPGDGDACYYTYASSSTPLPWPPPAGSDGTPVLPPQYACGAQRPGLNSTPAIGRDGTIYIVSRAHFNELYSYVAAVDPAKLAPKWQTSLRGLLNDGCGVTVPEDATGSANQFDCAIGATMGVDPATGMQPAATVDDDSSASPVALPDGGVLYGSLTGYNGDRGHLIKLDKDGKYVGNYGFGWDDTPAIVDDGTSYKIVTKENHYNFEADGIDHGPFYITELDDQLNVVWQFPSTNTQSCTRASDGTISCVSDHPGGFEWCIDAPAVDRDGNVFANSEDGTLYAIKPDGTLRDQFFLDRALGAAYTPVVIDASGREYALNDGELIVAGANP